VPGSRRKKDKGKKIRDKPVVRDTLIVLRVNPPTIAPHPFLKDKGERIKG
jgi:hypothetical protein